MAASLTSLTVILLATFILPLLTQLIPGRPLPEAVVLLLAGAVCGPHLLRWITLTPAVTLISQLGLAFLFLLAGYDIDPAMIRGQQSKRGLLTWMFTFAIAMLCVVVLPFFGQWNLTGISASIILTSTALGTLMPILSEKGLVGTTVGTATVAYGMWGELMPVLAMAILLSTRAKWQTILTLLIFIVICLLAALLPKVMFAIGRRVISFLNYDSEETGLTPRLTVRATVFLLVGLVTLSAVFNFDSVLGAFAAGFVLRYLLPDGDEILDSKIDGIANGFLIPIFFVVSGCSINIKAVITEPTLLLGFVAILIMVRAIPVYISLDLHQSTRRMSTHSKLAVAAYCTTALPVIVAVTNVTVAAKTMDSAVASTLDSAGAITVLIMPLISQILMSLADEHPVDAVRAMVKEPKKTKDIIRQHHEASKVLHEEDILERRTRWIEELEKRGVKSHSLFSDESLIIRLLGVLANDDHSEPDKAWLEQAISERRQRMKEMGVDPEEIRALLQERLTYDQQQRQIHLQQHKNSKKKK